MLGGLTHVPKIIGDGPIKWLVQEENNNNKIKLWVYPLSKGAFTLGVRDSSVESPNTMLVI